MSQGIWTYTILAQQSAGDTWILVGNSPPIEGDKSDPDLARDAIKKFLEGTERLADLGESVYYAAIPSDEFHVHNATVHISCTTSISVT